MSDIQTLYISWTPTLKSLLERADSLLQNDPMYRMSQRKGAHHSLTLRVCIQMFHDALIERKEKIDWQEYARLYYEHRGDFNPKGQEKETSFRVYLLGTNIEQIKAISDRIKEDGDVYDFIRFSPVKGKRAGVSMPAVAVLIFSLQYTIESETEKVKTNDS